MQLTQKVPVFPNEGASSGREAALSTGQNEWYIIGDKKTEKSSCVECNPVEEGGLLHSLWGRRCVATASRIAEGSGKDRDSFSFDFRVVAPVIFPP